MKSNHTFAIDFVTRLCKSDKTSALIFARITVNGERKEISLKENIRAKEWDSAREMVRGKSEEIRALNKYIDDVTFRIKLKFRLLEEKECIITAEDVKAAYLGVHSIQKSKHSLCELLNYHSKIGGEKLKGGTMKNYVATEEYLKRFIRLRFNSGDISLDKLNYEFITELEYYIRNNPLKAHDPCLGNDVMKHLERFKKMVTCLTFVYLCVICHFNEILHSPKIIDTSVIII